MERALGIGPGTEATAEAIRRILADGQPHAFTPDRRTTRILLDLALAGEVIVVGPIGGTVQAARADAGWQWSFALQGWVRHVDPEVAR